GRKIAVLVNEFGELGIDGELLKSCNYCEDETENNSNIVELTNGCLCCTVQEEFLPTMETLIKRKNQIDCILIETSGLALPKPLITAFRWPEIRNNATVDAVITMVDCEAVADGRFANSPEAIALAQQNDPNLEHETPLQELFEDQLACADLVILNKTDLINPQQKSQVLEIITPELHKGVKIITSDHGQISPDLLLGFNAAVEDNLDQRPSHHDHEEDHDHDDEINSTYVILDHDFEPEKLRQKLSTLVQEQEIYRIKGFVNVTDKNMRLVWQGVGTRFDHFYDRPWGEHEKRQTQLVFIGKNINSELITAKLTN
ncbi:MAG TPA: cobalamin biosynthesis protein CobW, partial [Allocoleopsis sp.]